MTKIVVSDWLFHYCEGTCTLSSNAVIAADGGITGVGSMAQAWKREYPDAEWEKVIVPHDWAVTMPFDKKCSSGTGYLPGGIGWYRAHLSLPDEAYEKRVELTFDGVYKNSQIWCNGYYLGRWANGYTGFSFDISEFLDRRQRDVVIAVKVSHPDIADSRWYTGSGITRKVMLRITDQVHLAKDSFFMTTTKADEDRADFTVNVETVIQNYRGRIAEKQNLSLHGELLDDSGETVHTYENSIPGQAERQKVTWNGSITNPKLWSVENPALYTFRLTIKREEVPVDSYEYRVGLRTIEFDPDKGCFLNGRSILLKGVCLHEDAGCLGNSVPKKVWKRRLTTLKEMGCNAIRMSHNPHSEELYDLCDEMGFLVIDELYDEWEGPKNKWSTGHNVYPPVHQGFFEEFHEWYKKDVRSFVGRNKNHPSIMMWSIGNEVDYPNDPYCHPLFELATGNNDANKPEEERIYNPDRPNAERLSTLSAMLSREIKKYDTTRPVTLAAAFPELSSRIGFFDEIDVIGYNYKEMFYEEDHKRFPKQPILGSENGHEYWQWKAVLDNDYISGQFLWTGIDYLGEAHGWPIHGSGAGHLTLAGFKKTEFYFRQSLWCDEPVLHMVTARTQDIQNMPENTGNHNYMFTNRWNYKPGEMIDIKVFTNQKQVDLFLNERRIESKKMDESKGVILFCIPYEPGVLQCKAGGSCSVKLTTTGTACEINAKIYDDDFIADGKDVMQIEVSLVDCNGNEVQEDPSVLHVLVSGEASLLGIENGDISDVMEYKAPFRRTYQGKLLIFLRATKTAGSSKVLIKGDGLRSKEINVHSVN